MKNFLVGFVILCTVGLAVWSYSEMNRTQETIDRIASLNHDIAVAKSNLRRLNAEWAYQNRPDRLAELSVRYFPALELGVMTQDHFARLEDIPMRPSSANIGPANIGEAAQ
ncbi:MAG: cell division protein FtsL [Planktomarina sp.]